jgi:hypothetical protein
VSCCEHQVSPHTPRIRKPMGQEPIARFRERVRPKHCFALHNRVLRYLSGVALAALLQGCRNQLRAGGAVELPGHLQRRVPILRHRCRIGAVCQKLPHPSARPMHPGLAVCIRYRRALQGLHQRPATPSYVFHHIARYPTRFTAHPRIMG